jgi:hypothetical protein
MHTKASIESSFLPTIPNGETIPFKKKEIVFVRTVNGNGSERLPIDQTAGYVDNVIKMEVLLVRPSDVNVSTSVDLIAYEAIPL